MKDCTQITPAPGAPVVHGDYSNADRTGWIASVIENENEVYSLGSGAMQREFLRVVVVFEDLSFTEISEGIAAPWMEKAQALDVPHKSEADALAMLDDAKAEQARKHAQRQAESEAVRFKLQNIKKAGDRGDWKADSWYLERTQRQIFGNENNKLGAMNLQINIMRDTSTEPVTIDSVTIDNPEVSES